MIRIDTSVVLLDGAQDVTSALKRLDLRPSAHWSVVRRTEGAQIYWYTFKRDDVLVRLRSASPDTSVRDALDLHEPDATPPVARGEVESQPPAGQTVVLEGGTRVVGVFTPPAARAVPRAREKRHERELPPGERDEDEEGGIYAETDDAQDIEDEEEDEEAPTASPPGEMRRVVRIYDRPSRRFGGGLARAMRTRGAGARRAGAAVGGVARGGGARAARPPTAGRPRPPHSTPRRRAKPIAQAPREFRAWPDVKAPLQVEAQKSFDLQIGFSSEQVAAVVGAVVRIQRAPARFRLGIVVVADGFEAPGGLKHTLNVVRDAPERNVIRVELKALPPEESIAHRTLGVLYSYKGNPCGLAQRNILVFRRGAKLTRGELEAPTSFVRQPTRSIPLWAAEGVRAPDLTALIQSRDGNLAQGNFAWGFDSPHVDLPQSSTAKSLGDDADTYARNVTKSIVNLADSDNPLLRQHIRGASKDIADHVPQEFWDALAAVAEVTRKKKRVPDVLLLTEEGHIPWELAWTDRPVDPKAPQHLGAQVNLGRWVLGEGGPSLPPQDRIALHSMAVVYGAYANTEDALPEAAKETRVLRKYLGRGKAFPLNGDEISDLLAAIEPPRGCEVVHFACHGVGDPTTPGATHLLLEDGQRFTPFMLRGGKIGKKHRPFLFLNACEVGVAGEELGELSGFVEAALKSEFRGFIGPLWQVNSKIALKVATTFYRETLEKKRPVAAVLRELRCKFKYNPKSPVHDTYLAYVFYGHPGLILENRTKSKGQSRQTRRRTSDP